MQDWRPLHQLQLTDKSSNWADSKLLVWASSHLVGWRILHLLRGNAPCEILPCANEDWPSDCRKPSCEIVLIQLDVTSSEGNTEDTMSEHAATQLASKWVHRVISCTACLHADSEISSFLFSFSDKVLYLAWQLSLYRLQSPHNSLLWWVWFHQDWSHMELAEGSETLASATEHASNPTTHLPSFLVAMRSCHEFLLPASDFLPSFLCLLVVLRCQNPNRCQNLFLQAFSDPLQKLVGKKLLPLCPYWLSWARIWEPAKAVYGEHTAPCMPKKRDELCTRFMALSRGPLKSTKVTFTSYCSCRHKTLSLPHVQLLQTTALAAEDLPPSFVQFEEYTRSSELCTQIWTANKYVAGR